MQERDHRAQRDLAGSRLLAAAHRPGIGDGVVLGAEGPLAHQRRAQFRGFGPGLRGKRRGALPSLTPQYLTRHSGFTAVNHRVYLACWFGVGHFGYGSPPRGRHCGILCPRGLAEDM